MFTQLYYHSSSPTEQINKSKSSLSSPAPPSLVSLFCPSLSPLPTPHPSLSLSLLISHSLSLFLPPSLPPHFSLSLSLPPPFTTFLDPPHQISSKQVITTQHTLLTSTHGVQDEERLQRVTILSRLSNSFWNLIMILSSIHHVTNSPTCTQNMVDKTQNIDTK